MRMAGKRLPIYAGMNINRYAEIATNREEWRTIVSNVVSDKEQR